MWNPGLQKEYQGDYWGEQWEEGQESMVRVNRNILYNYMKT
jgi:hypothetical protein